MEITDFRSKIKPGARVLADGKELAVKEVVKFRLDDGSFYIKCFLSDGYVLADDLQENIFLLVKELETPFHQPFPKKLEFRGKEFEFLYDAHAVAEEIEGEEIFKKGDREKFWDYKAKDGSYLSLGEHDETKERMDFYGKILKTGEVELK